MGWGIGALHIGAVIWGIHGCWLDFAYRRLPNWWLACGAALLFIGAFIGVVAVPANAAYPTSAGIDTALVMATVMPMALGSVLWFSIYFLPFMLSPTAIGAGDVKLAALLGGGIGLIVGAPAATAIWTCCAVVLAAVFTLVVAVASSLLAGPGGRRQARIDAMRRKTIAHGPAMMASVAVVWAIAAG
ncbi:MAG: prepilin peptidase [Corynebacterium sp.]|uniref:prepilin peptidase n=1 Tax=Corynebacterium sp. TaxID=1720 RepID=UPI0026DAF43C|nr:prepilin peptidase [Corynebacterium sp.]MDO5029136.1 prepilin peptidase [Corynebacterium sp.]